MTAFSTVDRPLVINGRFLSQRLSGVQRYAREITTALDRLIAAEPARWGDQWQLMMPPGTSCDLPLRAIEPIHVGRGSGHAWEQIELAFAARSARLVNLCNSGPLWHSHSTVVIHDAAVYRTPENFGSRYGAFHRMMGRLVARTSRLGTVSRFSQRELADIFGLASETIFVAGNGGDHLLDRQRSRAAVTRLNLRHRRYFLFVGSPTPNKNLKTALVAFARLRRPDTRLVVAGAIDKAVFGNLPVTSVPGVIVAPGLSDAEISGLYANAAAHVFPTRYEGFGIPPLEAMAFGCPVLASDIPPVREVCGNAADYFAPDDAATLTKLMAAELDRRVPDTERAARGAERVALYTWDNAARALAEAVTRRGG